MTKARHECLVQVVRGDRRFPRRRLRTSCATVRQPCRTFARDCARRQWSLDRPTIALFSAAGSYPLRARSPIMVNGTVRKPRAMSSSYARSSSSTFFAVNATPSRERNSFTFSQLCQALPVYTITIVLAWRGEPDIIQCAWDPAARHSRRRDRSGSGSEPRRVRRLGSHYAAA
jgi:hypothetical protein